MKFRNRNSLIPIALVSALAVAIMGAVFYEVSASTSGTVTGYVAVQNISAGTPLNSQNVKPVQVKATDAYAIDTTDPSGSITAHALATGDLVRQDDVVQQRQADVAIQLSNSPGAGGGDLIDVFTTTGGRTVLIGRHLPVVSGGGGSVVVMVPAQDEALWVSVVASGKTLIATKVFDQGTSGSLEIDNTTALSELANLPKDQVTGTAPAPSPSPSGGQ